MTGGVRVRVKNLLVELPQARSWIHPKLIGDRRAGLFVGLERCCLTARRLQTADQQLPQFLTQRVVGGQPLQLGEHAVSPPALDLGLARNPSATTRHSSRRSTSAATSSDRGTSASGWPR